MNYWKQIAEMLGVELGEEFDIDGFIFNPYKVTEEGLINRNGHTVTNVWFAILSGKHKIIKKPWVPKCGEKYYHVETNGHIYPNDWGNYSTDLAMYKCGWIFRTEEEAIRNRDRVLAEYEQVKKGVIE